MGKDKILVIGASGQIGVELTLALRKNYGEGSVIAADLRENEVLKGQGLYFPLDVMNKDRLNEIVSKNSITQIYHLAAILSATGEKKPDLAWNLNMQGLLNVLEVAKANNVQKVYWPSSIAVFGPTSPKINCPQSTVIEPVTVYGISKQAGEAWCQYYFDHYNVDVRSLRYPGLIGYKSTPGGGTTDYAVEIFYEAKRHHHYNCFLRSDTYLPMMYMEDAIRATIELMEAPANNIMVRTSYNIAAMSFSPEEVAAEIKKHIPDFTIDYNPDYRQKIADSWPESMDDTKARLDWNWKPEYNLSKMTKEMLENVRV